MSTDYLVIDEISMVSRKIFKSVAFLCRKLKGQHIFGGIQLLLSGGFYQLPPIKDNQYNGSGEYCFQSPLFEKLFQHIFKRLIYIGKKTLSILNV